MNTGIQTCPHCGAMTPDICGREVREVYDGVLFWTCDLCLRAWARNWTGFGRRQEFADTYVQQWNDHAEAADKAAYDALAQGSYEAARKRYGVAE